MVCKKDLINFEKEIARIYESGQIRAPIHLAKPSNKLIKIFEKYYKDGDWIFSTHRSHLHWLLSNRNPEELKKQILDGYSMHIFDKKFFTSAIVAGNVSIAVGVAYALKLKNSQNKVLCFVGDASFECGITQECIKYAERNNLPILFIIEDNGLCVNANTQEVWGKEKTKKVIKYKYNRYYNHAGPFKQGEQKYVMF